MPALLSIGHFSRATHLSVKTLRYYHESGLLEPVDVDAQTGYRRYAAEQIPAAQIIRRFRSLDMPLEDIRAVLSAPDLRTRNERITAHLGRLESQLARTQEAVAELRDLLGKPHDAPAIRLRRLPATTAAAITEVVDARDALVWFQGALGELYATVAAQHLSGAGPAGGIFGDALFSEERGEATIFVPCPGAVRPMGRVRPLRVPEAEMATLVHAGSHGNIDLAYGALAHYVARHALAVEGAIRETYLVGPHETTDEQAWRTEIGWPVFRTGEEA